MLQSWAAPDGWRSHPEFVDRRLSKALKKRCPGRNGEPSATELEEIWSQALQSCTTSRADVGKACIYLHLSASTCVDVDRHKILDTAHPASCTEFLIDCVAAWMSYFDHDHVWPLLRDTMNIYWLTSCKFCFGTGTRSFGASQHCRHCSIIPFSWWFTIFVQNKSAWFCCIPWLFGKHRIMCVYHRPI